MVKRIIKYFVVLVVLATSCVFTISSAAEEKEYGEIESTEMFLEEESGID